jgi:hypothetical protein
MACPSGDCDGRLCRTVANIGRSVEENVRGLRIFAHAAARHRDKPPRMVY